MIRIYNFEVTKPNFLPRVFQVAARGAGQARQRAMRAVGHAAIKRLDDGEPTGLDNRHVIAYDGYRFYVTFCGKHVGVGVTSMQALACAVEHEKQRWARLSDAQLMALTCDAINAEVKAGRASWADARRYAELWNLHKLSTSATVVDGVVCIVDGVA